MKKEKVLYPILVILLMVGLSGFPIIRYGIYATPLLAAIVIMVSGDARMRPQKPLYPFLLLLIVISFSAFKADYHWAKQAYFVFAYTSVYLFFDFSRIRPNLRLLNGLFLAVFVFQELILGNLQAFLQEGVSFADSKSALESTLAFPIGLFAVYFLYKKNYLWFLINTAVALLAFKRVVLMGIVACAILYLLPKRVRAVVLNPYVMTILIVIGVILQIELATGVYDEIIVESFGISTNQLLMGRQEIWNRALRFADFGYIDYLFLGLGHGALTGFLEGSYMAKNVLMHSDFMSLTLEHGFLFLILFSFLLNNQDLPYRRALALYLTILFASDNVLIYQHVMMPYLLLMMVDIPTRTQKRPAKMRTAAVKTIGAVRGKAS